VALLLAGGAIGVQRGGDKDVEAATLIVTATANEPEPVLSSQLTTELTSLAGHDHGEISLVHPSGGRALPGPTVVLTPMRGEDKETDSDLASDRIAENLQTLSTHLSHIKSTSAGLDLLTGLVHAGADRHKHTIYVLSSGLSTVAPLDWRKLGWGFPTQTVIDTLRRQGNLPDLRGHDVIFTGLGLTAPPQQPLTTPERRKLKTFWLTLCTQSGGRCTTDDTAADTGKSPSGNAATPTVPIDPPCTYTPNPGPPTLSLSNALLGFAGDSSVLPTKANQVLKPIAASIKAGDRVRIVGHTADYGPLPGQYQTSEDRALAVRHRLLQLGASPAAVITYTGVGPDDPVPHVPAKDPANRRVTLESTHVLISAPACLRS
jgi:outer membrane protein OmpA-like peptidoglycan-associated protein